MKAKKIFTQFTFLIEIALKKIGSKINECPTKEEIKNLKHCPQFNSSYPEKIAEETNHKNDPNKKREHKAKGIGIKSHNMFNRPRN